MPTPIFVSVEDYLATSYQPDCDYIDGALEKRILGEKEHSRIQANLIFLFRTCFRGSDLKVWPEWRFQIRPTRFRVPDLIVTRGEPEGTILREAPLLCIEILSPEDRWSKVTTRTQEYSDFGVPEAWIIDPAQRKVWICRAGTLSPAADPLNLEGTDIHVPFSGIFE